MNPTVALIPSAYKSGLVYSILPASGRGDFNFNRPSSATRVNKDGLVEEVVSNVPRLDYTNVNCPQLLLEPQSENLALYSGDLTNAEWEPFGNVVVTGGYIAPDGTNSAVKVSCDNIVSNSVLIQQSIGNSTRSRTIYARTVKTGTTGIANLCSYYGNNNNEFTITDQWQRFEVNGTSTATGQSDFYAIDFRGTTDLDEILLWAGQIEDLTYATSYIPTEATSVTRSRDLMTDSMASRPEITSDDWTLFLDFNKSDLGSDNCVSINDGTNDNSIVINNRTDDELAFILNQGGTVLSSYIYDITGIDDLKVCFSSTDTGASMVVNGVEIDRLDDGRFDASSLIQIDFTEYGTTNEFAGRVNDFRYYNVALSLNETIALTK
jgi:hypothetical protein